MCENKDCKCHENGKAVIMPAFLNYQSSNDDDKVMELVFKCIGELAIGLKQHDIKLYANIQAGVPTNPCGLPGYPPCPKG